METRGLVADPDALQQPGGLAEAQRVLSSGASAEEKAAAEVEVEVYTAIQDALAQRS